MIYRSKLMPIKPNTYIHDPGFASLRNAIYKQACIDWRKHKKMRAECERFLRSGSYGIDPETGEYILRKLRGDAR